MINCLEPFGFVSSVTKTVCITFQSEVFYLRGFICTHFCTVETTTDWGRPLWRAELTQVVRTLAAALSKWNARTLLMPSVMRVST